ncbi:hypothetical protein ACA910_016748 [Epithemia clementina (nom. ined.)]
MGTDGGHDDGTGKVDGNGGDVQLVWAEVMELVRVEVMELYLGGGNGACPGSGRACCGDGLASGGGGIALAKAMWPNAAAKAPPSSTRCWWAASRNLQPAGVCEKR